MIERLAVVMVVACAAPRPVPQAPPRATAVEIGATSCVAAPAVERAIRDVLAAHQADASGLAVRVSEVASEASTEVTLQIARAGEIALERRFSLGPLDCATAPQVLALAVDRWLSEFPEWAAPPLPPPPPPARWTELLAVGAVSSMWLPLGVDGQLGALVDHGPRADRFGGSLLVRASIPQAAGNGRFLQTALLVGASWRHRAAGWTTRIDLRGGALLVSGVGYAENDSDWLPWWEVAGFAGRTFGWGALGLEIAGTALQHRAVTRDGLVSEDIPFLRIGVGGMFGVRTKE